MGEEKRHRGLRCWQERCSVSGLWDLGWAGREVETDGVNFQGESGSLWGMGHHEVDNQQPELKDSWQVQLMAMPRFLIGGLDGPLR